MATTNKDLAQPVVNSTNWDVPLNTNASVIDAALGGNTTKNVTGVGTTPVVLTTAEYQKLILTFSGTLTANVTYHIPSGVGGQWVVRNATSGAFTLTIGNVAAGTSVAINQGSQRIVYSDGTNIRFSDDVLLSIANENVVYSSGGNLTGSAGLTYNGTALDITATTAATNTATPVLILDSQSSGTPAVGIGTTISFATETAAGNTETGMQISAVTTDVTSGSEDFDFVLRLMAAGAAPAIAFRVRPTGTVLLGGILGAAGGNTATINGITPALSSQAQAEAGTDNTTQMTPLRVSQAITALIGTATAGLAYGAVGTYAFLRYYGSPLAVGGSTVSGSTLLGGSTYGSATPLTNDNATTNLGISAGGSPLSGTWRCMGRAAAAGANVNNFTAWLRIS
jgi:hypothetical protein